MKMNRIVKLAKKWLNRHSALSLMNKIGKQVEQWLNNHPTLSLRLMAYYRIGMQTQIPKKPTSPPTLRLVSDKDPELNEVLSELVHTSINFVLIMSYTLVIQLVLHLVGLRVWWISPLLACSIHATILWLGASAIRVSYRIPKAFDWPYTRPHGRRSS